MSHPTPAATTRPTCPCCAAAIDVTIVNRAYDGDVVHLRRRADCPGCGWRGFDWKAVPRSAVG